MVGRPSCRSGTGRETLRRSGSGRETLPVVRNWSKDSLGGPELVERPSQRSLTGWETLTEVWKWTRDPP